MPDESPNEEQTVRYTRREIFEKYGPYTAPVVVTMLLPSKVYADMGSMNDYPTLSDCVSQHPPDAMTGEPVMASHCSSQHLP